jgi:putative membrane protein
MKHALLALTLIPMAALAAGGAPGSPDTSFYKSLAAGGMAEVRLGKLAQQKTTDPNVKEFAAMMVKDHSAANAQLRDLATSKGLTLPRGPGVAARAKKAELEVLSGHSFDSSYVSGQIKAHEETVALLQKEIASGSDADAKAFAQKILPTVQAHLQAADKLADGLGVDHH